MCFCPQHRHDKVATSTFTCHTRQKLRSIREAAFGHLPHRGRAAPLSTPFLKILYAGWLLAYASDFAPKNPILYASNFECKSYEITMLGFKCLL
jgi:hypothetical protein